MTSPPPAGITPAVPELTAPATLNLVTARTLVIALGLLGLRWSPVPREHATTESGLYTWAIGRAATNADPLDQPVAYVGIGKGTEGLRRRLQDEESWISETAEHIHGRALFRLEGRPVGGPVAQTVDHHLGWLDDTLSPYGAQRLRAWLAAPQPHLLDKAEQLCIRAAAHIGDCPPPLNSKHAGVWDTDAGGDWGGWAIAQRLREQSAAETDDCKDRC